MTDWQVTYWVTLLTGVELGLAWVVWMSTDRVIEKLNKIIDIFDREEHRSRDIKTILLNQLNKEFSTDGFPLEKK